jgi:hypothetical protein
MRRSVPLVVAIMLPLSACLNNQSIDDEIASKCGISVNVYKRAEASLDAGHDGMSLHAGRCRLTRTTEDVVTVTVINES